MHLYLHYHANALYQSQALRLFIRTFLFSLLKSPLLYLTIAPYPSLSPSLLLWHTAFVLLCPTFHPFYHHSCSSLFLFFWPSAFHFLYLVLLARFLLMMHGATHCISFFPCLIYSKLYLLHALRQPLLVYHLHFSPQYLVYLPLILEIEYLLHKAPHLVLLLR